MKSESIYPICVSLSEASPVKTAKLAAKFPFVELRLDAARYSSKELQNAVKAAKSCIVTCRPATKLFNLPVKHYSEPERQALLLKAIQLKPDFVDIEVESDLKFKKEILKQAKKKNVKVIFSLHNYKSTPSAAKLEKEIKDAKKLGADIVKIATSVKSDKDIQTLLKILTRHKDLVVIGMGEKGQSLRIGAPIIGSRFTFAAPQTGKETAPGQLAYTELKQIYKQLGLLKDRGVE